MDLEGGLLLELPRDPELPDATEPGAEAAADVNGETADVLEAAAAALDVLEVTDDDALAAEAAAGLEPETAALGATAVDVDVLEAAAADATEADAAAVLEDVDEGAFEADAADVLEPDTDAALEAALEAATAAAADEAMAGGSASPTEIPRETRSV